MWNERDQVQAHQFLRRRLVSALAASDANYPVSPSRRLVLGTILGAIAVLLVTAGFGVAGLVSPADAANWRQPGQVILEQGSGAHFVLGRDGLLHPVINQASALLLAGTDKTVTASVSALDSAPRGATLGIAGAPDSLPLAADLLTPGLVSCSSVSANKPAAVAPTATVLLTRSTRTGAELPGMNALRAGRGLLVQPPGAVPYLVAGGYRYRLPEKGAVVALGYQGVTALPVAPNWLDTLPAGRDLDLVPIPGAGRPGPAVGGTATRVGQVLATRGALGEQSAYYLVRAGGLEPITQTEAVLVLGDTKNSAAYPGATPRVLPKSVAAVASAGQRRAGADASGYPARVPAPASVSGGTVVICAAGNGRAAARVATGPSLPSGARPTPTGASVGDVVADQVYVPPGSGALVAAQVAPGAPATATYLITDAGIKFPVTSTAARRSLGYGTVKPAPVSPAMLALLPTGPALDQAAAQTVVPVGEGR